MSHAAAWLSPRFFNENVATNHVLCVPRIARGPWRMYVQRVLSATPHLLEQDQLISRQKCGHLWCEMGRNRHRVLRAVVKSVYC